MNKSLQFFQRKLGESRQPEDSFVKAPSVNSIALLASYKVSYRIALQEKPHTIAEELTFPSASDMVSTMMDEKSTEKLKAVPLSNDTVARRVCGISGNLEILLIEKMKDRHFKVENSPIFQGGGGEGGREGVDRKSLRTTALQSSGPW